MVQKLLAKSPDDAALIDTLYTDLKTRDFNISAHTNLILQEALLNTGKFEEYFSNANELARSSGIFFARIAMSHVQVHATDKMQQYVNGVYKKASQKIVCIL